MGARAIAAVAAAVLVAAASATAAVQPRLSVSRQSAAPGALVGLRGQGLLPHARYRVTLAGVTVKRGRTGRRGGLRVAFRVPSKPAGLYRVRVRMRASVRARPRSVASVRFRIRSAPAGSPPLQPAPQQPQTQPQTQPQQDAPPSPPPPPPPGPPKLVAAGDIACSPGQMASATSTECHHAETAELTEALAPDAVAVLGDNQYEHGEIANFNLMYDPTWGRLKDITFPAIGNHEYEGDPERRDASGYFTYFGAAAGDPTKGYYRWSLGGWTIFVLNSGAIQYTRTGGGSAMPDDCWPVSCAADSPQLAWLIGELDSLPDDACVLAYWHHPRFSSGFGGAIQDYPETGPMYDALYQHGAELVLNGHTHSYERFEPLRPDGAPDGAGGITNFVVGTGGRSLFTNPGQPQHQGSETLYTDAFGVLELTLDAGGWTSRFLTEGGETRDAASGSCHGPPAPG